MSHNKIFVFDNENNIKKLNEMRLLGESVAQSFVRERNGLEDLPSLYEDFYKLSDDAKKFFFIYIGGFIYEVNEELPYLAGKR